MAGVTSHPPRRFRADLFQRSHSVVELPWETRWEDPLEPGPVNDYLEVVDYDPSSDVFYAPVDLNDPVLLAQDGLPPSEGRPQFHQQMVFAAAMRTIRAFERALGRPVLWAGDRAAARGTPARNFTKRLRIYPHALLEQNAYYSPEKRALLFGYFKTAEENGGASRWVFTALSQDIVAHETTHAILHGIQQRSIEASNIDSLAFHEAFADIVALLQHFGMAHVVRHQLAQSRGSLRQQGLLTGLALQFGQATGRQGALRYALQYLSAEAAAKTNDRAAGPSALPRTLDETSEAHERGGFLVAAVFDAFVTIFERRSADLFRLARTGGTLAGDLPAELVERLADEAGKAADQVLRMCVRALDYIPPVDLHFGEYLRAIVTADADLVPHDPMRYRVAFVEAFKKRGITVPGCISMAPDSLLWEVPDLDDLPELGAGGADPEETLSRAFAELLGQLHLTVSFDPHTRLSLGIDPADTRHNLREMTIAIVQRNQSLLHDWFAADTDHDEAWEKLTGMRLLAHDDPRRQVPLARIPTLRCAKTSASGVSPAPKIEVHSARIARRAGPDGQEVHQLIIQVTQARRGYDDRADQRKADVGDEATLAREPDFLFRGGATIHVDLRDGRLVRIIRKNVCDDTRLEAQRSFRVGDATGRSVGLRGPGEREPFAFMHRSME
ncbi:hypothetical protein [Sphingomonas sp.]|uniref:hypothetical protein n=1 Tax=Sphingomonas sp. TaxID=28214 RepID=UPI0035BC3DA7